MAGRDQRDRRYGWRRLWIAPDDSGGVAVRGLFSANLHEMTGSGDRPGPRTLQAMEGARILLLRGESGAGKTVALDQEAERLRAAGKAVVVADLADGLCDVPAILAEQGGREDLTIFIDGLDMGLIRDRTLDAALRRAVPTLAGGPGARLRLALRTGFAAEPLIACLAQHFGDAFEQLTLAPLRAEDVHIAAVAEGIDPHDFLAAIEALRVAPLAARPPTLRMLLRLWEKDGRLPTRRDDLYRQGCEALLREANETRLNEAGGDDPDYAGDLEPSERFAVATRLAALMTFGDHAQLDLGAEPNAPGLYVDEVTGGIEVSPGHNLRVSRKAVREVVGTALFRPAGRDGFAFAHPSFMRFLGATFLARHGILPAQGLALLSAPDGRIGANRIEVASWLGVLEPAWFDHLCAADPQVLLRSGIPAPTSAQRLRLARALVALNDDGCLDLKELDETGDLVLLAATGLDAFLAGVLTDKAAPLARRLFACTVAKDSGCAPVATCGAVAMDADEPLDLRRAAITALGSDIQGAESALLALSAADAPDEDIHIAALGVATRSLLSPAEVIRRLKPGRGSWVQNGLCLRLLREIAPKDLPEALAAVTAIATEGGKKQSYEDQLMVAQGLVRRALAQLDDDGIGDALATFIATLPTREPWLRWSFPLDKHGLPAAVTIDQRRALVAAVVARAPGSLAAARNLLEACFLLRGNDLPWIVSEARAAFDGPAEPVWSTLVVEVARGLGDAPDDRLRMAGATAAEIGRFAQASLQLESDYERWAPPRAWDPVTETFGGADQTEPGGAEDDEGDEDEEPILSALADWKLLTIQTEAGGRADAPAVTPTTLLALAQRADRRLVRDSRDLLRVVRQSLERLQARLKGRDALVRALWDEGSDPRPKDENFLSDVIVDHLRRDLIDGGVVADREVQIRARLGGTQGERTDIQVQAFTNAGTSLTRRQVASLTIEVKGCWNKEVYTAMKSQLVERYLATTGEAVGLYLVGWYVCSSWKKARIASLAVTPADTLGALRDTLDIQAHGLSGHGHYIEAAMIDATLT